MARGLLGMGFLLKGINPDQSDNMDPFPRSDPPWADLHFINLSTPYFDFRESGQQVIEMRYLR